MKKLLPVVILVVIVIAAGVYFSFGKPTTEGLLQTEQNTEKQTNAVILRTYTDSDTGFTFEYPSQYEVRAQTAPTGEWGSRLFLTLDDMPNAESSSKPRAVPMTVGLQKQPVGADGKIYNTIAEYQKSANAAPDGKLVTVNGVQALYYRLPPSDMTGVAADNYFFIKDGLIYEVGVNPQDPYADEILQSISWK